MSIFNPILKALEIITKFPHDIWNRVVPKNNLKQLTISHEVKIVAHWVAYFLKNCYKVRKGNLETSEQLILGVSHLSSSSQQK